MSSIMAEALVRELGGDSFEVFSAGAKPTTRVHPLAMAQLRPGISNLDLLSPKSWLEFTGAWAPRMDIVIAMCDQVADHAHALPGQPVLYHWHFGDPLAVGMTDAERARSVEKTFWQILRRVNFFIAAQRHSMTIEQTLTAVERGSDGNAILMSG